MSCPSTKQGSGSPLVSITTTTETAALTSNALISAQVATGSGV